MATITKQLTKCAAFTDIHWGAKGGAVQHNQDCLDFVSWFVEQVKLDPSIDHIMFLGDWFDQRSAINVETLNFSYKGAKLLNELGLPIFFIVGNHDMYHRHSRDVYSTVQFNEFEHFTLINQPTVFPNIGKGGALICPYLFHDEYHTLDQYTHLDTWWGHFEFRGFVVTGHSVLMPTGPEADSFKGPTIFSGHFHKRQANKHVIYIGNAFPQNFADAGDSGRGMCIYDHTSGSIEFEDWEDCPKYQKCTLSSLIDKSAKLLTNARVRCIVDVEISFEESAKIKQAFVQKFNLREFTLEESKDLSNALKFGDDVDQDVDDLKSVDDLIMEMLNTIDAPQIDKALLIKIFQGIV